MREVLNVCTCMHACEKVVRMCVCVAFVSSSVREVRKRVKECMYVDW